MRALVTGAGGFVGRHLVAHLRASGDDVTTTDVPASLSASLPPLSVSGRDRLVREELAKRAAAGVATDSARPDALVVFDLNNIRWLTGFTQAQLQEQIDCNKTFAEFFAAANLHTNAPMITGVICGVRIEEIEDQLMRKIRYMDKLVDELAKGRPLEKILRN